MTGTAAKDNSAFTLRLLTPRVHRTHREFAEAEVVIPTGEYRNQPWRVERQPWTGVLFDEIDSGLWSTIVTTGPSQSGKTQACFAIPTLHTIAELRENHALGLPDEDMANKKWLTDLLPILKASPRLRGLIPVEGPGSRGGKIRDTIQFTNGVICAIMTRGSGDAGKAGFTARRVHVTEAADWSKGVESSEEADPLRQLRARQRAFSRKRRRLLVEGTVKVAECLPWSLKGEDDGPVISSNSRLLTPCPHCGAWICPEREHFVGWKGAETEDEACNEATFICPTCTSILTDDERRTANRDLRLVHHGQSVNEQGEIVGERPPTSTLWFRYTQWHNMLQSPADLAEDEWKASQMPDGTQDRDNAERELCQFQWCMPFKSTLTEQDPLKPALIRKRTERLSRNVIPDDTQLITVGVDIGDWTGWWLAFAWRADGSRHIFAYGNFDIKRNKSDELDTRIPAGLQEWSEGPLSHFRDSVSWIDGNYMPDSVARFIRSQGTIRENRFHFCRGAGKSTRFGGYRQQQRVTTKHPRVGREWFAEVNYKRQIFEYTFNADYWKLNVHEGLRADKGAIGRITLFEPDQRNEHAKISNHFANEQLVKNWEPDKGFVEKWIRKGDNHWLDCAAMASAAGDFAGVKHRPLSYPHSSVVEKRRSESDQELLAPAPEATAQPSNWYEQLLNK